MADLKADLADLVRAVHAYAAWHGELGVTGFPREALRQPPAEVAAPAAEVAAPAAHVFSPAPDAFVPAPAPIPRSPFHESEPAPVPRVTKPRIPVPVPPPPGEPRDKYVHLPRIEAEVKGCTKCRLHATRTNTVFFRGNPNADVVFVGEGPGADEDLTGTPFVGRAGQLLDKMIGAMGLVPESDVYICNIVKCRPPENRRPEPDEVAACIPYLHEQLDLVAPKVIVALGNTALAALLGTSMPITKVRGTWKLYRGLTMLMPTFHPSYLLRPTSNPVESKRLAWGDLQLVMKELCLHAPQKR